MAFLKNIEIAKCPSEILTEQIGDKAGVCISISTTGDLDFAISIYAENAEGRETDFAVKLVTTSPRSWEWGEPLSSQRLNVHIFMIGIIATTMGC